MLQRITCGPMFAGKTTSLLRDFNRHGGIVIRSNYDIRYSNTAVVTHNKEEVPATSVSSAIELLKAIEKYEHVFIDELHFFIEPMFHGDLFHIMNTSPQKFFCYGLDFDWKGDLFPISQACINTALEVERLEGTCSCCGQPSKMTYMHALKNKESNLELGHNDVYEPRCLSCWDEGMKIRSVA